MLLMELFVTIEILNVQQLRNIRKQDKRRNGVIPESWPTAQSELKYSAFFFPKPSFDSEERSCYKKLHSTLVTYRFERPIFFI
ncbi:Uncharacterized protein APZ42_017056 [Daphnia magna]|uniref:Uncharacterized protein n=1 Tax=Daphnia magna TaxID=35525 RepID=A0A165A273_9CRUS|nr:Uncharacterized protein APZ42_017056 [Daphnia magna]